MILPVVMAVPEHQAERAHRLADYCFRLDRTEVWVTVMTGGEQESFRPEFPGNRFHSLQAQGIHRAAVELGGHSFIWLEADAIPLKPDWALILSEEYERCGKKFLLSSDTKPHDRVGGIGCYPKETEWLLPQHFPKSSWDLWLIECAPHLVARTELIQHSYCVYNRDGFCKEEHRFPRDQAMLRKEAVIFHRDPNQDLIKHTTGF